MLTSTGHSHIYQFDSREEIIQEEEDVEDEIAVTEECMCETESMCSHTGVKWVINECLRARNAIPSEFDIVTSVTQNSINVGFYSRWDAALAYIKKLGHRNAWEDVEAISKICVAEYAIPNQDSVDFYAKFSAPKVQLVCKEGSSKVILYLMIEEGHLLPRDKGQPSKAGCVLLLRSASND